MVRYARKAKGDQMHIIGVFQVERQNNATEYRNI